MKRLIINILLFVVATFLLLTIGLYGLIYTLIFSSLSLTKDSFINFWANLIYSINVGIDQIGNVVLALFLNHYAIKTADYPFGKVDHTISHVLAVNYFKDNVTTFGLFVVNVLEYVDPGHMEKSL